MTKARDEVDAYIWWTAGTASAGSPRVSTDLQLSLWPSTPPALSIALVAASHDTRYVGPERGVGAGERRDVGDGQGRARCGTGAPSLHARRCRRRWRCRSAAGDRERAATAAAAAIRPGRGTAI